MNEINSGELLLSENKKSLTVIFLYIAIFVMIGMLAFLFFITLTPIRGESMENTVFDGQYCVVQRNGYNVERGDIVTLNTSEKSEKPNIIIKRVIGMSGDKLLFMLSQDRKTVELYICRAGEDKFTLTDEPYIKERMTISSNYYNVTVIPHMDKIDTVTVTDEGITSDELSSIKLRVIENAIIDVPARHIFFLGDNRNNSRDSRYYGSLSINTTTGKVLYIPQPNSAFEKFFKLIFLTR